jgi:hypothetical protein
MNNHIHRFEIESTFAYYHRHKVIGYTDKTVGFDSLHFHIYKGECTLNNHSHHFQGFTSLPIKTKYGHVHLIDTVTDITDEHQHSLKDKTFEDIDKNLSSSPLVLKTP